MHQSDPQGQTLAILTKSAELFFEGWRDANVKLQQRRSGKVRKQNNPDANKGLHIGYWPQQSKDRSSSVSKCRCIEVVCRALAVGAIAIGSKAAVLAKSAGGAGSLLKGAGALLAAGTRSELDCHLLMTFHIRQCKWDNENLSCRWPCCCCWWLDS